MKTVLRKKIIGLLSILLMVNSSTYAQNKDSVIQKLIDVNLLKKEEVNTFEKYLEEPGKRYNINYLDGLYRLELEKLIGNSEISRSGLIKIYFEGNREEQQKATQTLVSYLSKLKSVGLVTEMQYEEQMQKIDSHAYAHVMQLLPVLSQQSAYEEWLKPVRLHEYAEKLFSNNVLTVEAYKKLNQDITAGKIKASDQLLAYYQNTKTFDLANYSNNPAEYLEQVHKDVATILPQLSFSDFSYIIEADTLLEDYVSYHVIVSVKANGKIYKQKSFISPKDIGKDGNYFGKIGLQEFYQLFNKILTDQKSSFRLHQVTTNSLGDSSMNYQYFGVGAFTKEQSQGIRSAGKYINISYENFKQAITSEQIDSAILSYKNIGLLKYLSPLQMQKAKDKIKAQDNRTFNNILTGFPDLIYSFDAELGNLQDPYAELIRGYEKISHGAFNPKQVSDDFDIAKKKKVTLKFSFQGKQYNKVLKIEDDWVDPDFFKFVNNITAECKLSGQFYDLYTEGQDVSIIYLTPDQYDFLKQNKLAVFGDEWEDMLEKE